MRQSSAETVSKTEAPTTIRVTEFDAHDSLAARAKSGDRSALNALLELHLNPVHRFVSVKVGAESPDVDDIVQETLIGAAGGEVNQTGDQGQKGESGESPATTTPTK